MRAIAATVAAALMLAGCAGAETAPTSAPTSAEPVATAPTPGTSDVEADRETELAAPEPVVAPECEPGPGKKVTQLEDQLIDGVVLEDVEVPEVELPDGTVLPAMTIDAGVMPPATVDAGCIVEYDAPGGCLPRVEVAAGVIPERVIPAITIPERSVPGGPVQPEVVLEEVVVEGRTVEGFVAEMSCLAEGTRSGAKLFRTGGNRLNATVTPAYRYTQYVEEVCQGGICLPRYPLPQARTETMSLPVAHVESMTVEAESVGDDVQRFDGDRVAYVAPADVLFDLDSDQLRPGADRALRPIAEDLSAAVEEGQRLLVEGHTDSSGTDAYNLDLSRRRAETVTAWLVAEAGIEAGRIEAIGLGESVPAADNGTDEGRAQNRRVVVSTAP